ncbi:MAG: hypothetical protein ABSD75_02390 [Terriglobales bacterium]|jgi:hypothetical protein
MVDKSIRVEDEILAGPPAPISTLNVWWRVGDFGVLGLWIVVVSFAIHYHEKWADEGQAWLIARDLDLRAIWFHELRYEGSPGLWHTILWVAQHVLHARYDALSFLAVFFAFSGIVVLLLVSPFPRPIRWLMAFTYFFVYQYAVIARPYVLFPLFCLVAARQFQDLRRPQLFALALVPLANLTTHGSLVAFGLALAYAGRFLKHWSNHDDKTRKWFAISAVGIALMYLFLFFVLRPPVDVEALYQPDRTITVIAQRSLSSVVGALVDNTWLSLAVFLIFGVWCYLRGALASFLLPVALLVALYGYANGAVYHQGTIFISMMIGLMIAWPSEAERRSLNRSGLWSYRIVVATLATTLCYQVASAAAAIRNEIRLPYSGAEDMAKYLAPLVKRGKVIYGNQYGMVAINAYFDHNIFGNWHTAYYHHSVTEYNPDQLVDQLRAAQADYIVAQYFDPFDENLFRKEMVVMSSWGYPLDHFSDGYLLTKIGPCHCDLYMAFRKEFR